MQGLNLSQPGLRHDPQWYRTAVFYEVLVRAFSDSKGSGSGDFRGLVERRVWSKTGVHHDTTQRRAPSISWLPSSHSKPSGSASRA